MRLVGLAGNGQLVLFQQTGQTVGAGYEWSFTNLATQHLAEQGQSMPQFVGGIISYAVGDKQYIATCNSATWCYYGYPRTVTATARYQW